MLDHHADGLAIAYACASITAGLVAIWLTTALVRRTRALV
jgi:fluoride ion exporter CrcB/FEX